MGKLDKINTTLKMSKEQKKKTFMIVGIIVGTILTVTIIVLLTLVFATDVFKSDKELFLRYANQIVDVNNGFLDKNLTEYLNKKEATPYNNDGQFSSMITVSDEEQQEILNDISNFNITFSGKVDKPSSKSEEEIKLNFAEEINFPIKYKHIGNMMGLQSDEITEEYISIDSSKLENLFGESGISMQETTENVSNIFNNIELTPEQSAKIQNTYITLLEEILTKEHFSKVIGQEVGYRLTIKGDDIKNVIAKLLETLKNDQDLLNKVNEILPTDLEAGDIDSLIENVNSASSEDLPTYEITIYSVNKKVTKLAITTNNNYKFEISKKKNEDELKYDITYQTPGESTISSVNIGLAYNRLKTDSVSEIYNFGCRINDNGDEQYYSYNFTNNINFAESVDIADFEEDNQIVLTNYGQEQVSNFIVELMQRIQESISNLLQKAEISEDKNPLLFIIPGMNSSMLDPELMLQGTEGNSSSGTSEADDESGSSEVVSNIMEGAKKEACERINMTLNIILTNIMTAEQENRQITTEEINKILIESGLGQDGAYGSYEATGFTLIPEGDDNTVIALRWKSSYGEDVVTGQITYDANAEFKYDVQSAE